MKLRLTKILIVLWLLLLQMPTSFGAIVSDPDADFLAKAGIKAKTAITHIEADLNNDGVDDKLYTVGPWSAEDINPSSKAGLVWLPYLSTPDGFFVDPKNTVIFRTDAIHYGYVKQLKQKALLTYAPASAEAGTLFAIYAEKTKIKSAQIKEIHPKDEDKSLYQDYFLKGRYEKIFVEDVEPLDEFPEEDESNVSSSYAYVFADKSKEQFASPDQKAAEAVYEKQQASRDKQRQFILSEQDKKKQAVGVKPVESASPARTAEAGAAVPKQDGKEAQAKSFVYVIVGVSVAIIVVVLIFLLSRRQKR